MLKFILELHSYFIFHKLIMEVVRVLDFKTKTNKLTKIYFLFIIFYIAQHCDFSYKEAL